MSDAIVITLIVCMTFAVVLSSALGILTVAKIASREIRREAHKEFKKEDKEDE